MKKSILLLLLITILNGCCFSQIGTQFYFATDSCDFYLPDYFQDIVVSDNCCLDYFIQTPPSGQKLIPGEDMTVTIEAGDCYGNTRSMSFDVVIIDTIPPSFHYDSTLFLPTGMYQNNIRTYHFYTVIDSASIDSLGNYTMTHYYK